MQSPFKAPRRIIFATAILVLVGAAAAISVNYSEASINSLVGSISPKVATPISECIVDAKNDVIVGGLSPLPTCNTVILQPSDNPPSLGTIDIKDGGTLLLGGATSGSTLPPEKLHSICIEKGGTVKPEGGTAKINSKIELEFIGDRGYVPPTDVDSCYKYEDDKFRKGIDVQSGGTLILKGEKGVPSLGGVSWTTLAAPAGIQVAGAKWEPGKNGTTTLHLTDNVAAGPEPWAENDWIVVATTDYDPFHSEFVQIKNVTPNAVKNCQNTRKGCSIVTLKQPLVHYHFGSIGPSREGATCTDPFDSTKTQPKFLCDNANRNFGVDERAEVGLISRDVYLTSQTEKPPATPPANPDSSVYWGGEIKIHQGFKQVVLQGVRLSKFGKDQLGSYPIHFHKAGILPTNPSPALIDADSVDHSYNKCVTIHETSNLTISNLVCARIVGHIFYEELGNYDEDNVADDSGIVFHRDLGIGAMSNSFDIYPVDALPPYEDPPATIDRAQMIKRFWWAGDYMTNDSTSSTYINYDGFNIPDTDNQQQAVHGSCTRYDPNNAGAFGGDVSPLQVVDGKTVFTPCKDVAIEQPDKSYIKYPIYIEPASGFWIQNPKTVLTADAIAGCQGVGRGVWWVIPNLITVNGKTEQLKFSPIGTFRNDRVSACYAGFYDEGEYSVSSGEQLFPHQKGTQNSPAIIGTFFGMTATRNRFRGVWLRPVWFVIKDGHFASNRESVTLVTSGGIDGNAPGVWDLLEDSALIGYSENNPGRWGPCPYSGALSGVAGGQNGCVDRTSTPTKETPHSGSETGLGYEQPNWNDFGYMLYDGPVRVFHDRFINYNYNRGWTAYWNAQDPHKPYPCPTASEPVSQGAFYNELDYDDCKLLQNDWEIPRKNDIGYGPPAPYEGDAALGWFQSNQSAYPTATASKQLMWVNTNLRHQIYTEHVGVNTNFNDGDKNTAIIDEDGTLSGLGVSLKANYGTNPVHAFSLNNLPFNSTSNSVDECKSRGGQNDQYEGRDTSLMSPTSMGTLEFSSMFPWLPSTDPKGPQTFPGGASTHWQDATFTRTDLVRKAPAPSTAKFRPSMTLQTGRNGLGIWEPKVTNGYGYYVKVSKTTSPSVPSDQNSHKAGLWSWIDVGLADVVDPNITTTHPFYIRLGIDYKSTQQDGSPWPAGQQAPPDKTYFKIVRGYKAYTGGNIWSPSDGNTELTKYWTQLQCHSLDSQRPANLPVSSGGDGYCPAGPTTELTSVDSIDQLTTENANGTITPNVNVFYYDKKTGYLWLNIVQDKANPIGPSPLGSCDSNENGGKSDPSCPHWQSQYAPNRESYYACPKEGCVIYAIEVLNKSNYTYKEGPSTGAPSATNLAAMSALPRSEQNQLEVIYGKNPGAIVSPEFKLDKDNVPFHVARHASSPSCPATQHDGG